MPKNNNVISREKAEVYDAMGIPYVGYVKGVGYQSLHAFALGSCYFQNSNYCIPHFQMVIDSSSEEKIKSLKIDSDDLIDKLVKTDSNGGPTINMGHGKYSKLSNNCEIVAKVIDGERFMFGYRDRITGKEEITSGKLTELEYIFGDSEFVSDIHDMTLSTAPLGEINLVGPVPQGQGDGVGQPGTWEGLIPIWGSGRAAVDHFQNGNYWSAAGHTALAISDVFLVKSIVTGVAKGGVKMLGKCYKTWGSYRSNYGKTGFAAPNQQLHHWAWARNGEKSGEGVGWWAKNQMWNLMPMESQAMHTAVHGWGRNAYGPVGQFWFGTPIWFKASIVSGGGRLAD